MNKRHLLLATRAEISDGAARTLLEIMLHVDANGEVPSLTDLTRYRGRGRSVVQSHISELIKCGILAVDRLVESTEGYGKRLSISADGLAKANGFKDFNEVSFEKFIGVKAGNVKKSTTGTSLMPFAQKPKDLDTPHKMLKYFQVRHQERYKQPYEPQKGDQTIFKSMIRLCGKTKTVAMIDLFFEHNHSYRCSKDPQGLFKIRNHLERKSA